MSAPDPDVGPSDVSQGNAGAAVPIVAGGAAVAALAFAAAASEDVRRISTRVTQGAADLGSAPLPPVAKEGPKSREEAARFLIQATFGPTRADIDNLVEVGFNRWLDRQFVMPPIDGHLDYVRRGGPPGCTACDARYINAAMETFWSQAVTGPDQLRQRLVFALHQIFVVSTVASPIEGEAEAHAAYLDMLGQHCFGNYRDLLEGVALHPAMGLYLSHLRNQKEDATTGRIPDENFAREVMQLFSIGLWELNEDGSRKKTAAGADIPTYGQAEIAGMAKVFTGWSWGGPDDSEQRWHGWNIGPRSTRRWDIPMRSYARYHSTSAKTLVRGGRVPAGASAKESLKIALDSLYNHPNVGPFIGSQLIKRFVTSNPSPAYVARVARAFANNGLGVRGDMKAVMRAVLMDSEARDAAAAQTSATFGKVREPVIRFANWMRAFGAKAPNGRFQIWNVEDPVYGLAQNPMRAPSVFNWYRPDYSPPGAVAQAGLVAPEFQITHETTTTGYANFVLYLVEYGYSWGESNIATTYPDETAAAKKPELLLNRLALLLTGGRLTAQTRSLILNAINSIRATDLRGARRRVQAAIVLIMISPDYIVQK